MALSEDIYYNLRIAYMALLSGQITSGGQAVPIKNGFYSGSAKKYIILPGASSTGISNKTLALTKIATQFSIFCKGDDLTGNEIDDIGAQLLSKALPYPGFKVMSNEYFDVINSELVTDVSSYGSEGNTATKILERNIIIEYTVAHLKRSR